MDDPLWELASWTSDFVDIEGDIGPTPRFRTRAKMLWSTDYLYVAAELQEPHLWATLTERDSIIFHDNDFEVFIDPDGDAKNYAEFEINALNTIWDLRLPIPYRDGGDADNSFDLQSLHAVHLNGTLNNPNDLDVGWTVELAFPFSSFRALGDMVLPPQVDDAWRINFSRVQWHLDVVDGAYVKRANTPEDNWVWSPQGMIDMHQPEQWGFLHFRKG